MKNFLYNFSVFSLTFFNKMRGRTATVYAKKNI